MICNMCPRHETCPDAKNGCEKCDIGRALHEERRKYLEQKAIVGNLLKEKAPGYEPEADLEELQESEAIEIVEDAIATILDKFCKGKPKISVWGTVPFTETRYSVGKLFNAKKQMVLTVSFIPCKK